MSVIPLLTEINEKGKISFKVQMLRNSGRFTTMILTLHKRKNMIYVRDSMKNQLQKAIANSILTGTNITSDNSPVKTIDIDKLYKVERCRYQRLTVFLHYKTANDKYEKIKQIQFFRNNDMFAFLTAMCSVDCNLFDAPDTQFKTVDNLVDMFKVKLMTFNMSRKGLEFEFERFINMTNGKDIVIFGFQECKLTARAKVME